MKIHIAVPNYSLQWQLEAKLKSLLYIYNAFNDERTKAV